ncbi:hypothetical protein L345_09325, partial [Ophiophagus hannah]
RGEEKRREERRGEERRGKEERRGEERRCNFCGDDTVRLFHGRIASVKPGFSFLLCDQPKFRMAMEKNQGGEPTVRSFHPLTPFLSFQVVDEFLSQLPPTGERLPSPPPSFKGSPLSHGEVTALRSGIHLSWVTLGSSLPRSLRLLLPLNKEKTDALPSHNSGALHSAETSEPRRRRFHPNLYG